MGGCRTWPAHNPAKSAGVDGLGDGDGDRLFFAVWPGVGECWLTVDGPFVPCARCSATAAAAAMTTTAPISHPARRPSPARARLVDLAPDRARLRWSAGPAPCECRDPVAV